MEYKDGNTGCQQIIVCSSGMGRSVPEQALGYAKEMRFRQYRRPYSATMKALSGPAVTKPQSALQRVIAMAFVLAALLPSLVHAQQLNLDEAAAGDLLVRRVQAGALYAPWTKIECLRFILESETPQEFSFVVRERHEGKCPGDPAVEPVVDRFRVNRATGEVLRYQPADGSYKTSARGKRHAGGA
jgi:hypothetical protein